MTDDDLTMSANASPSPVSDMDASCRVPVFTAFFSGAAWLVLASVLGLLASIKLHKPGFLADCSWLSYGHANPAAMNALLYGFALQAGLGVALWLLATVGRAPLFGSLIVTFAFKLWNLGVTAGVIGILAGDSTGYDWLEMPRYASMTLFFAYTVIGVCALLTFHLRSERGLSAPQWFLMAALLWFPWIYSTAQLLLVFSPVRGVMQGLVNFWFIGNLQNLVLAPLGLAAFFYFVPQITGRPLHSQHLAAFAFWTVALFGGWCGIPLDAPFPAWVGSASNAAASMMILPILAVALNLHYTTAGLRGQFEQNPTMRFLSFGALSYLLGGLVSVALTLRVVGDVTRFTWFNAALTHLTVYGFVGMTLFGAIYHIAPRLAGAEWPSSGLIKTHFWAAGLGTVLYVALLGIGGVREGMAANQADIPFNEVAQGTLPFIRFASTGELLLALGHLAFLVNVTCLIVRAGRNCCACCPPAVDAKIQAAEVAR